MTQQTNSENGEMEVSQESQSDQLKPVKSKPKKILSAGLKLLVGGAVVTVIGSILLPSRTMGVMRSARMDFEKRKAESEKAIKAEITNQEQAEITGDEKQVEHVEDK